MVQDNTPATAAAVAIPGESSEATQPKMAQIVKLILKSMGVYEADPRVVHQLMEFTHRSLIKSYKLTVSTGTTVEYLEDAMLYAEHAGRSAIALDDVKMAIQARVNAEFTGPPPREIMAEIAEERNKEPLPMVSEVYGVRLPPERHCLTQPNYRVLGESSVTREMIESAAVTPTATNAPMTLSSYLPPQQQQQQFTGYASKGTSGTTAMDEDEDYDADD